MPIIQEKDGIRFIGKQYEKTSAILGCAWRVRTEDSRKLNCNGFTVSINDKDFYCGHVGVQKPTESSESPRNVDNGKNSTMSQEQPQASERKPGKEPMFSLRINDRVWEYGRSE